MERREEVYEKALELFTAEGYHATSLSRVAEELGLAQASLYHYFSSKKELLFLVYERCLKRDLVPIIESARKIKDPDKRILYLTREYTKANIERGASSRVLVREAGKLKPEH